MAGNVADVVPRPRSGPGQAGQGAAALLLGIAGTAAGAGIATAHLAKAGLDAAAVLAVIVLATSLFLLGWGTVALVRAVPGWWRLLAVPTALVLLEFVLLPLTVAVNATSRPPGPLGTATPASYGFAYQDVAFRTADGVRLSGWYRYMASRTAKSDSVSEPSAPASVAIALVRKASWTWSPKPAGWPSCCVNGLAAIRA